MGSMENTDLEEFPPPPPEVLENADLEEDEDEGEKFDFDSGDDAPEADRQPLPVAEDDLIDMGLPDPPDQLLEDDCGAVLQDSPAPTDLSAAPKKVNPYSVIDIAPFQEGEPTSIESPSAEDSSSPRVPSGYSVPVPCGYAVPSNLPLLLPAYSTPVIIRNISVDEQGVQEEVSNPHLHLVAADSNHISEDFQAFKEEDVLAKWVSDPANTEWMENPDEVIYDDVPRENSDSATDPEEMIYDDVENGEEAGNSSLDYGWSSSEFESYDEQSDSESKHGVPNSFLRGGSKRHVQRLMKAAKEGTKDGLEKTKAAVKKGRSYIRTKSFVLHGTVY